jgi:myo-inositol-1(or 4)-monophosphatase
MSETLEKMIEAAKAGGTVLRYYFGQSLERLEKSSSADFRTKADVESEKAILEVINKYFPDYNILSEESGSIDKNSEYKFIIDPLDGTNNFVLGIPNFTVAIGLLKGDRVICGVVYVPMIDSLYYAEEDGGAYHNGITIKVSDEVDTQRSTFSHMCGYLTKFSDINKNFEAIRNLPVKRLLDSWSVAYDFCMLASGKIEGILNYGSELYDFAAGRVIAREAGAVIVSIDGSNDLSDTSAFSVIANNSTIKDKMVDALKHI